jgi:prolyl 4-hydroxylase
MAIELNDLIKVYDNVLSKDVCDSLISFFENNSDKQEKIDDSKCPSFTQINFTENHKIDKKTEELHKNVILKVLEYKKKYYEYIDSRCFPENNSFEQFRIKKYKNNGKDLFDTHVDVKDYSSARRYLSFLFYLNDVDEGGETIFEGMKISPKCGRMIVFPPLWMYPHKGCIPKSNSKYIMSTYLHYK